MDPRLKLSNPLRATLRLVFVWFASTGGYGMADPVQVVLADDTAAAALQDAGADAVHGTKILHVAQDTDEQSSPPVRQMIVQQVDQILRQLAGPNQGYVNDQGGLNIGVHALVYEIAGVKKTYAGEGSVAMTDDETNYVYLDGSSGTDVQVAIDAFPDDVFMLAEVVCASGDISSITDQRMRNAETGLTNAWASIAASQTVNFDSKGLDDLAHIEFTDATKLTVSSGSITPTQGRHTVEGEGGADDSLDTIVATEGNIGRLLILSPYDTANPVTVRDAAITASNIELRGTAETHALDANSDYMMLEQYSDTAWREVFRTDPGFVKLYDDLDASSKDIAGIGIFGLTRTAATIAAGTFNTIYTLVGVNGQGGADDDLYTVSMTGSGETYRQLLIYPNASGQVITVKHGIGADCFDLAHDTDFAMDIDKGPCALLCWHDGIQWIELWRGPWDPAMMNQIASDSGRDSVPFNPGGSIHISGALSDGVHKWVYVADHAFTIKNANGYVIVAPSGGVCTFDLQLELAAGGGFGSIIGGSDSDKVYFTDGVKVATSQDIWQAVAVGDKLRWELLGNAGSPNGAEDATLTINGRSPMVDHE